MAHLDIKSETLNKGIELIKDSTKETRNALDANSAKGINKIAKFISASPIGIKIDTYIAERPYKLKKAIDKMKLKYEQIPENCRKEPSSYIALKGSEELNYALDEEHLKEMFSNLLVSDMDSRKKSRVLPSYIEIIKQLSKDDAEFLKLLYRNDSNLFSISTKIVTNDKSAGYTPLDDYIIYDYSNECIENIASFSTAKLNNLITDSLIKNRLIEKTYSTWYNHEGAKYVYDALFNSVKSNYTLNFDGILDYDKGFIKLTDLGKNFIDICLS